MSPRPRPRAEADGAAPALASRAAALAILDSVIDRHRPLDDAVSAALGQAAGLAPRDRAHARLLATTAIRRLGQIDDALSRLVDQPLPVRPPALMNLLRLGAVQLLFLDTPPHAAVATAVELAGTIGRGRGKGMTNAVLRRLAREAREILDSQDAARLCTPDWLWQRWTVSYGDEAARAIAGRHLTEPPLDITLKPTEDRQAWAERLEASVLPSGTLRRPVGGRIEELPGFDEGAWWIQDAAAALPARLFGDLSGRVAYDLCAAPGGKTAQLAAAGADVTAIDRSAPRLALVDANLERLGLAAATIAADALAWEPRGGVEADAVLLDAPCMATGTIRRHPDVALGKGPDDLAKLTRLQSALFDRAARWVKPGGTLVYCTCSLEPDEGERQIARFLAERRDFARRPVAADEIGGLDGAITPEGDLRTLPTHLADQGGMDGFFAARLVRTAP